MPEKNFSQRVEYPGLTPPDDGNIWVIDGVRNVHYLMDESDPEYAEAKAFFDAPIIPDEEVTPAMRALFQKREADSK